MFISNKIFDRLSAINMSQSEFSRQTGISTSTINEWKNKKTNPSVDKLVTICKVLGISFVDLLCDEEEKKDFLRKEEYETTDQIIIENILNASIKNVDWNIVEGCLKDYIGSCTEIIDTKDLIYIGSDFPDEYANSKDAKILRGANEYAKANASAVISELIQVATNKSFSENFEKKHNTNARYGWFRYDTRFAIPKYGNDGELIGYNIFKGRLVIRCDADGNLYLYDI